MSSTDIKWSCTSAEDPFYPIAENQTAILFGYWADDENNEYRERHSAAEAVAEDYFDTFTWEEWFGEDDSAIVRVVITSPESAAGTYEVEMERVIKATAKLLEE